MNNVKRIPLILMLLAGAITAIIAYIRDFTLINFLWILLASLLIFYIIGTVLAKVIMRFEKQNKEAEEKEKAEEGAVIEKEAAPEDIHNTSEERQQSTSAEGQNTPEEAESSEEPETE